MALILSQLHQPYKITTTQRGNSPHCSLQRLHCGDARDPRVYAGAAFWLDDGIQSIGGLEGPLRLAQISVTVSGGVAVLQVLACCLLAGLEGPRSLLSMTAHACVPAQRRR